MNAGAAQRFGQVGLQGHDLVLWVWGTVLVVLTAIYAWATVAFGLRFSNLTYRGVLTNGPYRFTKHPAYLAKNTFWWLETLPFLVVSHSLADMVHSLQVPRRVWLMVPAGAPVDAVLAESDTVLPLASEQQQQPAALAA